MKEQPKAEGKYRISAKTSGSPVCWLSGATRRGRNADKSVYTWSTVEQDATVFDNEKEALAWYHIVNNILVPEYTLRLEKERA